MARTGMNPPSTMGFYRCYGKTITLHYCPTRRDEITAAYNPKDLGDGAPAVEVSG